MMEKFHDDAEEWERRHRDTWMGRMGGSFGTGVSAQIELMSPLSVIEFTKDPSLFNLAKASYGPGIAMGGYSWVSWVTGQKIYLGERIMHSVDMTRRTVTGGLRAGVSVVAGAARRTPAAMMMAALAAIGYYGSQWYGDFTGSAGIGDMSAWR